MDDTENMRILRDMAMGRDVSAGDRVMAASWAVREIVAEAAVRAEREGAAPVLYQYRFQGMYGDVWRVSPVEWNGLKPVETRALYTHPPQASYESDGLCKEADGCPTEKAVLQRYWRESQASATVPDAMANPSEKPWKPRSLGYAEGWNACRAAMLAASQPDGDKAQGVV